MSEVKRGRHSKVYLTEKYAIKIFYPEFFYNFKKEVYFLNLLQPFGFVPRIYSADFTDLKIVMERIRGSSISESLDLGTISRSLDICFILDKLGVQKEEMNHPERHIVVSDKVYFLDFDRSHLSRKPSNVTQFCSYLKSLGFRIDKEVLRDYKKMYTTESFENLKRQILLTFSNKK